MKVIVLACLVGLAMCAPQQQRYEQPAPPPPRYEQPFDSEEVKFVSANVLIPDPEPYQFSLAVADDEFTNYQSRVESQDENGNVQGEYSWVGPDGIRYITQYTADPINGFQSPSRNRLDTDTNKMLALPRSARNARHSRLTITKAHSSLFSLPLQFRSLFTISST
ncbi:Larval cuticle protein A2B [Portunus trituberculatus]|uniref:Larval cuticle protein A2B n=1 Tax=Portunus trituberculatus TaxID=210409 RepID=A0A5B7DS44_PORTR|nr:Larval cuticle protein A2B [Portunus trituberculatus]